MRQLSRVLILIQYFIYQMNIKCIVYARYSTSIPIYTYNKETSNKALSADVDKIPQKIKALKSRAGERDKLRTPYGVWFVTHDDNDISYAVCTSDTYPERHAYGLIEKLQEKIGEINHCQYETEENIKSHSKRTANELADKYNDLSKVDKLSTAMSEVNSLKDELGEGIKKVMGNQDTLNNMNEKAQKMKNYASQFEKNSDKLEKLLYWRNCKIKIIVGLCIAGLLGFVILIIVQRTQSTSNSA